VDREAGGKGIDSISVSLDWVNRIDYIPHTIGSKWLSVKYLISRSISGVLEYEPLFPTYLGATARDHWWWNEAQQRCKRGSGARGWWRGGPQSRYYKFIIEPCSHGNQQRTWSRVSRWDSEATECPSFSPITRWPCSRPQVFNSRPAWNEISGPPGLGHLVYREEMSLGCYYARSTGGGWNVSWKDFYLGCSCNALQIGDWESCNGVATVHGMGEYRWTVGDFGGQQLSQHCRWRVGVVSTQDIEFCAPEPVGDPDNTPSQASSTYIGPWTNLGGHNAQSCRVHQDCHRRDDTWNRFPTCQLVAQRKCESQPQESERHDWWARKLMEYPPCVVWYLIIHSETINQWQTLTLSEGFWDFW